MLRIDTLKLLVEELAVEFLANSKQQHGKWLSLDFLEELLEEIEELEERWGEKDTQQTVTQPPQKTEVKKPSIFNFQRDEFGVRFIGR